MVSISSKSGAALGMEASYNSWYCKEIDLIGIFWELCPVVRIVYLPHPNFSPW
ncbi:hypothetical protein CCP3SC15_230005 [Gammaproteobacteria bacterium]